MYFSNSNRVIEFNSKLVGNILVGTKYGIWGTNIGLAINLFHNWVYILVFVGAFGAL
jgi:hypothetical protein